MNQTLKMGGTRNLLYQAMQVILMQAGLRTSARDQDSQVKPPIQSGLLPLKQKKIAGVKDHSGLISNSTTTIYSASVLLRAKIPT